MFFNEHSNTILIRLSCCTHASCLLLGQIPSIACNRQRLSSSPSHNDEPCLNMTVYYHDILYDVAT